MEFLRASLCFRRIGCPVCCPKTVSYSTVLAFVGEGKGKEYQSLVVTETPPGISSRKGLAVGNETLIKSSEKTGGAEVQRPPLDFQLQGQCVPASVTTAAAGSYTVKQVGKLLPQRARK